MAKRNRFPITLIALVAMATGASTVFAQDGPPQDGGFPGGPPQGGFGQGGPGQGGPRGGMRMGPPHGPQLLLIPQVVKELKESEEQIQKIRELMKDQRGGPGQGGQGGPPPQGGQGFQGGPPQGGQGGRGQGGPGQGGRGQGGPGFNPEQGKKMEAAIKKILNETQYKRYRQIDLQVEGPRAFQRPEVVEALQLSEDQMDQMREIMEQNRPQGGPGQGGQGGPGQGDPGKFADDLMKKLMGFLSDGQKSKWKEMTGAPFKLERPKGGQGGPGGRGGFGGGQGGPPPQGGGFGGGQE